jgi:hypothetical protein
MLGLVAQAQNQREVVVIEGHSTVEKSALLLLGGAFSGVGLLARCLEKLGFAPGCGSSPATVGRSDIGGPTEVADLNDRILTSLGSAWDRPALFVLPGRSPSDSASEVEALVTEQYLGDAIAALRSCYADAGRIVADDPRIALFPKLWETALHKLGFSVHRVLVFRNPIEIAEALWHERGRPRAMQLWLRYVLCGLMSPTGDPPAVISLDALTAGKAAALIDLFAQMQLAVPDLATQTEAVDRYLADALEQPLVPADVLLRRPLIPALVKDTYRLCLGWPARTPKARSEAIIDLAGRFEEFCLTAGAVMRVPAEIFSAVIAPDTAASPAPAVLSGDGRRSVIIHYHLFKNAGTSIDTILKRNFGARWAAQEYVGQRPHETVEAAREFLFEHPEVLALSSHTLHLPPPEIPRVDIFPIIFVRHPIDRLKSAYIFEREQPADTVGARLAKETDFAGYISARLKNSWDRSCRNAQTYRLAMAQPLGESELERAIIAFNRLPFVGSVEYFSASIVELARVLLGRFPGFHVFAAFENVSRPERSLTRRLAEIKQELGDENFDMLAAANADDLVLYQRALARYTTDVRVAV